MPVTIFSLDMIEHSLLIAVFFGMLVYTIRSRDQITRYVRSSRIVYWFIVGLSGLFALVGIFRIYLLLNGSLTSDFTLLFDSLFKYPCVVAQSFIIFYLIANKIVSERSFRPRRVLAIGAHPDDLEVAVGATLARMNDHGHIVFGLVMTHGSRGGDAAVRLNEVQDGAKFLGFARIKILDFDDTRLSEKSNEMIREIEDMIRETKPDLILTHSIHDVHQDHQAVYGATLRAARNLSSILSYEGPSVTQEFHPTFFIDTSGYVEVKLEAVRTHWDQRNKPYMKDDIIEGVLIFRGGQARVDCAEGFEVVRMLSSSIGEF